ncbi:MAG: hypothetical protein CVU91_08290 [Firmicutes bacterium HGW-Firmicutes-16]|nr:MAG: hypothetical protein CVU91_08290 [Firmicutes bacterium HGW-Firmicutes-16]
MNWFGECKFVAVPRELPLKKKLKGTKYYLGGVLTFICIEACHGYFWLTHKVALLDVLIIKDMRSSVDFACTLKKSPSLD